MNGVLNSYISYMSVVQNKSTNTINSYKLDLEQFLRFIKKLKTGDKKDIEKISLSDLDVDFYRSIELQDIYNYLSYIENERFNSSSTRARKIAVIRSFFRYLHGKIGVTKVNICEELEAPKQSKKLPVYLSLEESKELLSSIDGRNQERDFCIITLFLNCGLRLSELISIKVKDIRGDTLIIRGKGDKERVIYLNESCLQAINVYLRARPKELSEYLFLSEQKKKMSKRTIQLMLKKYLDKANLDTRRYTPHKLRHTAATLMYKHGNVDIRSLQLILGHENISTTTIYTHVDSDMLRNAVRSNPLNK